MAKRRTRTKDSRLIAAVDIGGAKASCVIAALAPVGDGSFEPDVLGVGQYGAARRPANDAHSTAPVSGLADLEVNLRGAVEAAERMAGEQIKSAYVAVPGRQLRCRRIGVDLALAGGVVTREDVSDCLAEAARNQAAGFTPLHARAIRQFLDGEVLSGSAEGLVGDLLTAEILSLGVRETTATNIEGLLHRCGLEADGFVAAPFAAGEATLIDDEKELGAVLIDMGARHTDYAVYDRGALVAVGGIALGGENITRDIAHVFGATIAAAERAKTFHGSALSDPGDEHRLVDFPQLGGAGETERQSRAALSAVIASRLEEIFEKLVEAMTRQQGEGALGVRRVVLTGGGSLLLGAAETAERVIGAKARLGRPVSLLGAPEAARAPQFASVIGVAQYAASGAAAPASNQNGLGPAINIPGAERFMQTGGGRALAAMGSWLRANF
ncbi:MAG: cell division protein FtsA [Pseudomonadota bacterium]